jgi:hypothetical protein
MVNTPHEIYFQVMKRRILTRKPEGKRPLRRRRHRWESTIQVELTEIGWEVAEKLLGSQEGLC